jgi:hypothetical protein
MVRIARDITRIAAEIMAENFTGKTLLDMSQLEIPTDAAIAPRPRRCRPSRSSCRRAAERPTDPRPAAGQGQPGPGQADHRPGAAAGQQLQGQIRSCSSTPTIEKVMALLREQRLRPFVLDIETDSTIAPDENAQKQRATEFVTAVGGFMKEALPLVQTVPQAAPWRPRCSNSSPASSAPAGRWKA